jgi:hypothetical protein
MNKNIKEPTVVNNNNNNNNNKLGSPYITSHEGPDGE